MKEARYQVWHSADGFPMPTHAGVLTHAEALAEADDFPRRYMRLQGYYSTVRQERIDPYSIELKIERAEDE